MKELILNNLDILLTAVLTIFWQIANGFMALVKLWYGLIGIASDTTLAGVVMVYNDLPSPLTLSWFGLVLISALTLLMIAASMLPKTSTIWQRVRK